MIKNGTRAVDRESIQLGGRTMRLNLESGSHPIVMACDEAYAMPLATTLRSIVEANRTGKSLDIVVLTSDFSPGMKQKVLNSLPNGSAAVHWAHVELASFEEFSTRVYISKMTFARLLLPQFFPGCVSKVLYLDADLLVLDDPAPLWEIDLEGAAFGAVVDTDSRAHAKRLGLNPTVKDRSMESQPIPDVCEYFNAGVLLVDLVRWKQEQISEKALQYMMDNPQTLLADQDALNVACGGWWKKLDARWNCQEHEPSGYSRVPPAQLPSIIHFAGKRKPWIAASLSVDAAFYDAFRTRTQFARTFIDTSKDQLQYHWHKLRQALRHYRIIAAVHSYFVHPKAS